MGYNGREPLTTLVWLTGSFSHPGVDRSGLVQDVQALVDREQIAIIGVSGTVPLGKAKFSWSEDPERDFRRIKAAVQEVAGRVNVKAGWLLPWGFRRAPRPGSPSRPGIRNSLPGRSRSARALPTRAVRCRKAHPQRR